MSGRRDAYREVGEAMRQAIDAVIDAALADDPAERLTRADCQVVFAVFRLTASYSKLSDDVFVYEIAKLSRLSERQARRSLGKVAGLGIIEWLPRRGTDRDGKGRPSTVGLPAAKRKARAALAGVTQEANRPDSSAFLSDNREGTEKKVKTTLRTEGLRSTSTEAPRAREETPEEAAELDHLYFGEAGPPHRGAYWEPNT